MIASLHFAQGFDVDVSIDLDLAGQARVGVFAQVFTQPEFFHEGQWIGVVGWRDGHAVGSAEAITVTIQELPHTTVDINVMFEGWIANMISFWYFHLYIFAHKSNHRHSSILLDDFVGVEVRNRKRSATSILFIGV